jgi:hypothetical protein
MQTLLIIYLAATAASFAYVGVMCWKQNKRPAAIVGFTVADVGILLIAWTLKGVIW